MLKVHARGEEIRRFILENVELHPDDISRFTAEHFQLTRQAVNRHLKKLVSDLLLGETGKTKNRSYTLNVLYEWHNCYPINKDLAEDIVWRNDISKVLADLPDNVSHIWEYAFTEMFNNAIDHSGGSEIYVHITKTAVNFEIGIMDNGVGIFKKIQTAMNLLDERHAVLELSKGKLTTDPKNHTGEGIFFTSRMLDEFCILSGGVFFTHKPRTKFEDMVLENKRFSEGTTVWMNLSNNASRTTAQIFDEYAGGENYGFNKTVVPVRLAQYGNDRLVSRSQARRVLDRIEMFKKVLFDFTDVNSIGQAFADEIFRVFRSKHPEIEMYHCYANQEVKKMIQRALSGEIAREEANKDSGNDQLPEKNGQS